MIHFSYDLIRFFMRHNEYVPGALVVAAANMLIQNFVNLIFGSKGLPKLRGYRGE